MIACAYCFCMFHATYADEATHEGLLVQKVPQNLNFFWNWILGTFARTLCHYHQDQWVPVLILHQPIDDSINPHESTIIQLYQL